MAIEIISELLASTSPDALSETLTQQVRELTGARTAAVLVAGLDRTSVEILHVSPLRRSGIFTGNEILDLCKEVTSGERLVLPAGLDEDHPARQALIRKSIDSLLVHPLKVGGETTGWLVLLDLPGVDRVREISQIIHLLAPPIALAIRNSLAFRQIEKQSEELEKKVAERTAELSRAVDRQRTIIETAMEGFWLVNGDLRIVEVNDTYCRMSGFPGDELIGAPITLVEAVDTERDVAQRGKRILLEGMARFESRHRRKDGSLFDVEVSIKHMGEEGGHYAVFIRDITERKTAEAVLRLSEERFRLAVLNAPFPIMIHAEDGEVVQINGTWTEMSGYTLADIPTVDVWTQKAYGGRARQVKEYIGDLYGLSGRIDEGDYEITTRSGEKRFWDFSSAPLGSLLDGRRLAISMAKDVTDRKHLEAQLRQSQKMESIGQLAGGVAHDFNNLLTVIVGYASMLKLGNLAKREAEAVEQILATSEKAAQLTRGLLTFGRKQPFTLDVVDLNGIVVQVEKFLVRIIGEDIKLKIKTIPREVPVSVDQSQIDQVLINLAANSRDAMPRGGLLLIETGVQMQAPVSSYDNSDVSPGPYAWFSVSDSGLGMDDYVCSRIFEPFFTTKEVGKGTGLGMAIVFGIVKQHKGVINVYSEVGHGTTFKVYLPLAGGEISSEERPLQERVPVLTGNETLLVVEDDAGVMKMVVQTLEEFGYQILQAQDGEEAVDAFRRERDRIDLVLMDVIMPKKSGKIAYDEISAMRPGIKTIFTSGYPADFIETREATPLGVHLLMKPVQPIDLLRKIREVLDQ
ncbi:PAS domain S-box protein [Geomonas sp. Red32]|uniref:PAS domain S-box protein n=1 Tax=Geomonas sp. Red32 TaxID=2912856 RepID=UPI00202CFBF2|nr:PAS domain S-box protein [Geomonas sp. Red32]MCM0083810.1 PAS domain S-box protein [Geomonas sp. Red32]